MRSHPTRLLGHLNVCERTNNTPPPPPHPPIYDCAHECTRRKGLGAVAYRRNGPGSDPLPHPKSHNGVPEQRVRCRCLLSSSLSLSYLTFLHGVFKPRSKPSTSHTTPRAYGRDPFARRQLGKGGGGCLPRLVSLLLLSSAQPSPAPPPSRINQLEFASESGMQDPRQKETTARPLKL
jgi:hypothetical protein